MESSGLAIRSPPSVSDRLISPLMAQRARQVSLSGKRSLVFGTGYGRGRRRAPEVPDEGRAKGCRGVWASTWTEPQLECGCKSALVGRRVCIAASDVAVCTSPARCPRLNPSIHHVTSDVPN